MIVDNPEINSLNTLYPEESSLCLCFASSLLFETYVPETI